MTDELMAALNPPKGCLSPEQCDMITTRWEQVQASKDFTESEKSLIFRAFVERTVYGIVEHKPPERTVPVLEKKDGQQVLNWQVEE